MIWSSQVLKIFQEMSQEHSKMDQEMSWASLKMKMDLQMQEGAILFITNRIHQLAKQQNRIILDLVRAILKKLKFMLKMVKIFTIIMKHVKGEEVNSFKVLRKKILLILHQKQILFESILLKILKTLFMQNVIQKKNFSCFLYSQ